MKSIYFYVVLITILATGCVATAGTPTPPAINTPIPPPPTTGVTRPAPTIALATCAPLKPAPAAQPNVSPPTGRIAFRSDRDNGMIAYEIYVINADGTHLINLTNNHEDNSALSWSPDGQRIAFASYQDNGSKIYVMNADGSHQTRLTNTPAFDDRPNWSPDGQHIVFVRGAGFTPGDIYIMDVTGSHQINLTNSTESEGNPTWSPDGQRLVFNADWGLYVMNADGSDRHKIAGQTPLDYGWPIWSPDGQRIFVYASQHSGWLDYSNNLDIFSLKPDGSDQRQLTTNPTFDDELAVSPNGQHIAFIRQCEGKYQLYVMNVDGSQQVRLTDIYASGPNWSPDSQYIVFAGYTPNDSQIYVIRIDGSYLTRLTAPPGAAIAPVWSPK